VASLKRKTEERRGRGVAKMTKTHSLERARVQTDQFRMQNLYDSEENKEEGVSQKSKREVRP